MKIRKLLVITTSMLCLASCSLNQDNKINNDNNINTVEKFEKDNNTLTSKEETMWNINNTQKSNEENIVDPYENIGEITLENVDTSTNWNIVNNKDIEYNDVTYHNLYENICNLESPYGQNNLINFIIKTYNTQESDVYTRLTSYNITKIDESVKENINNTNGISSDAVDITIDENLRNNIDYQILCDKYNDKATWTLDIYTYGGKNKGTIAGCKSFMLFININGNVVIDMSEYDNSDVNTNTSQQSNQTQQGVEGQSENTVENNTTSNTETQE